MGNRIEKTVYRNQRKVHKGINTKNLSGKVTNKGQNGRIRFYSRSMFAIEI